MNPSLLETHPLDDTVLPAPARDGSLIVERLQTTVELKSLAESWNRLAGEVPFRRWEWLEAWWLHFAEERDELFVLTVRDAQGELVGLAPWYRRPICGLGRVVRFLGSGEVCSDYLTILAEDSHREAVIQAIVDWLRGTARRTWDAIELQAVAVDDPNTQALAERFAAAGHLVHRVRNQSCWRLEFPESWEAYLAGLSRTRRGMARKLTRTCFDTGRAVPRWAENATQFEHGWKILVDLHQRRQRTLGHPGCFATARFEAFLKLAARRLFAQGRARLQWIELDGCPVAVELDLVSDDTVYLYQSGIEPELVDQRPGWLGTLTALRRTLDDHFRYYDFIRGDEEYKAHWRAQPIELVDLRIVSDRQVSHVRDQLWRLLQVLKQQAKHLHARWQRSPDGRADKASNPTAPIKADPA